MKAYCQFQRVLLALLPNNGKDMLKISVRSVVIINNYLSAAIYNSLVTKKTDKLFITLSVAFMTHWVNVHCSLTTLLFLGGWLCTLLFITKQVFTLVPEMHS